MLTALRRRCAADEGFTLVEIIVAMALFGIVATATTPLLVASLRATTVSRTTTQAKDLLAQRLDVLRNLPFHVPSTAGDYRDLLDTYYRDATGTSANARCASYAYAAGTYTCVNPLLPVRPSTAALPPGFSERVRATFQDANRVTVVPPSTYDSRSATADRPAASTLLVSVTVTWTSFGAAKSLSSSTALSAVRTAAPQVAATLRASAVTVDTLLGDTGVPDPLHLGVGVLSADASLSTGATARAVAQGAVATTGSGSAVAGAAVGRLDAPADQPTFTTKNGSAGSGGPCGTTACFGPTSVSGLTGSASAGLPQVATSAAPATAVLRRSGSSDARGFAVSPLPVGTTQAVLRRLRVQDAAVPPTSSAPTELVRSVQGGSDAGHLPTCAGTATTDSSSDMARTAGHVTTTGGSGHDATACATATARRIDLFPTAFAPDGVVQVVLEHASLRCRASTTSAVTAGSRAQVRYWTPSGYQTLVVGTGLAQTLPAGLLAQGAGGVLLGTAGDGTPLWLGDYLQSWSAGAVVDSSTGRRAQGAVQVVSLTTRPVRDADTTGTSALHVVVGDLACLAVDER